MFAPKRLGPTLLITAFTLTSLSTIIVAIRFCCRIWVVGRPKLYDYVMLAALFCTWGICVDNYWQVYFGTGRQVKDQPKNLHMDGLTGTLKTWYWYQIGYLFDLLLIKLSILFFYRSIATQRPFRIAVDTTSAIVCIFTIVMMFVNAFECPNPSDAWSRRRLSMTQCLDLHPIYYTQASFNILSDIWILGLPMPVLLGLNMHKNKKIALIGIFSVGSMAVVASSIRLYALYIWTVKPKETPYTGAYILLWSQIEINTGIITASIPSLKPLFKRYIGGTTRRSNTKSRYWNYGGGGYQYGSNKHGSKHIALTPLHSTPSIKPKLSATQASYGSDHEALNPKMDSRIGANRMGSRTPAEDEWPLTPPYERRGEILKSVTVTTTSRPEKSDSPASFGTRYPI